MKTGARRAIRAGVGVVALGAMVLTGTMTAYGADPAAAADKAAASIRAAAPAAVSEPQSSPTGGTVVETGGHTVNVPLRGGEDVTIGSKSGITIPIRLPKEADGQHSRVADDGTVVYGGAKSVAVAVQTLERGVRISTVLADGSAPTSYSYSFGEFAPQLNADGSATLTYVGQGFTAAVGHIDPPWAVDAHGVAVPTRYILDGKALVQVVDHNSGKYAYPIVADPTYGWGWSFYVFFNHPETAQIATMGWGAAILATACGFAGTAIGGAGGAAVGVAVCVLIAGSIVYQAGVANYSSPKQCIRLAFSYTPGSIPNVERYGDSRCSW